MEIKFIEAIPAKEDIDLIELYMSYEDEHYFGKGFYYDSQKEMYELKSYVHEGWFQDSVLLFFGNSVETNCVCRYFPNEKVEFYDTLYGQQDYSTPMLIHNTGKRDLVVGFQMYSYEWKIEPGTSKYIIPYQAEMEEKIMFELVPSETMRQIFKEDGFEFSDFQKATLIWNAPNTTRQERIEALMSLADTTEDVVTKTQIYDRLDFEKKVYETFLNNLESEYVYVVMDDEYCICGFFADYDRAVKYAMKYGEKYETKCVIKKYRIIKDEKDMVVRNPWKGNPNMGLETEDYSEYDGEPVAGVELNENGEILSLWSNELTKADEDVVDEFRIDRFESHFIKIPFALDIGCPVRDVVNDTYGILAQGKKDWEKYLKKIEDRNLYVDYSDVQVIVYELTEKGYWSHEHVNPLYLDVEFPPHIKDDEKSHKFRAATEALGDYMTYKSRGRSYPAELVIKTAKAYAEVCCEKSHWEKIVDEAERPEELLW